MILHIHLKPQKKFDRIEKHGETWKISIKAQPKDNEANEYLIRYLSEILKLPASSIKIRRGHTSRHKQIEIESEKETILDKLRAAAERNA